MHRFPITIASMGMVYLCIHEWLVLTVNAGKYTTPMDPMRVIFMLLYASCSFKDWCQTSKHHSIAPKRLYGNWDLNKTSPSLKPTFSQMKKGLEYGRFLLGWPNFRSEILVSGRVHLNFKHIMYHLNMSHSCIVNPGNLSRYCRQ